MCPHVRTSRSRAAAEAFLDKAFAGAGYRNFDDFAERVVLQRRSNRKGHVVHELNCEAPSKGDDFAPNPVVVSVADGRGGELNRCTLCGSVNPWRPPTARRTPTPLVTPQQAMAAYAVDKSDRRAAKALGMSRTHLRRLRGAHAQEGPRTTSNGPRATLWTTSPTAHPQSHVRYKRREAPPASTSRAPNASTYLWPGRSDNEVDRALSPQRLRNAAEPSSDLEARFRANDLARGRSHSSSRPARFTAACPSFDPRWSVCRKHAGSVTGHLPSRRRRDGCAASVSRRGPCRRYGPSQCPTAVGLHDGPDGPSSRGARSCVESVPASGHQPDSGIGTARSKGA
jgi:hypothetical protein